ncbi:MAG: DUF2306 domain-containing protein [Caulobacter sp.]|nr:DUF2306 domain-containing protein [Caulobacter sp.]
MTQIAPALRPSPARAADKAMRRSASLWVYTALIGQMAFALYVAAFYGGAALGGRFEDWNEVLVGGYRPGGTVGNVVLGVHLLLAVVITLAGPVQLLPWLRKRAAGLHRWNGRIYMVAAIVISLAGLYAVWTRGTAGGVAMRVGVSLNGLLIIASAALAWRAALGRRFDVHRRWALRLFLLVSGVWFFRIGLMLWILIHQAPVGIGKDFDGPFVRFLAFGCYLIPLAVLELYLRAGDQKGAAMRWTTAGLLLILTLCTAVGIFGAFMGMWLPHFAA